MDFVQKGLGRAVEAFGWLAQGCALVLVLLVAGNVLVRYFLSEGLVSLQELEWHLVSPIALFGMSYALRHDAHVRVDVFFEHYPPRLQAAVDLLSSVLLLAVALYLAWIAVPWVMQSYGQGEGSPDPGGLSHRWLLKAIIPLGFVVLALQAAATALETVSRVVSPAPAGRAEAAELAHGG